MNQPAPISLLRINSGYALVTWENEPMVLGGDHDVGAIEKIKQHFDDRYHLNGVPGLCLRAVETRDDGRRVLVETTSIFAPTTNMERGIKRAAHDDAIKLHNDFAKYMETTYPGHAFNIEVLLNSSLGLHQDAARSFEESIGTEAFDCMKQWGGRPNRDIDETETIYGCTGIMAVVALAGSARDDFFAWLNLDIPNGATIENIHHLIPDVDGNTLVIPERMCSMPDKEAMEMAERIKEMKKEDAGISVDDINNIGGPGSSNSLIARLARSRLNSHQKSMSSGRGPRL